MCYNAEIKGYMDLKLIYKTAFPSEMPFDGTNKRKGEFLYSLIVTTLVEEMQENSNEISFIDTFCYYLNKSGISLNGLEKLLINISEREFDVSDTIDSFLYHNFGPSPLFNEINKIKEINPRYFESLTSYDGKPSDLIDSDFHADKLFVFLSNKRILLKQFNKTHKSLSNLIDGVYNLADPQRDYSIFLENFIKKEHLKLADVKKVLNNMLENCNSYKIQIAKNYLQNNPKSKMVNKVRARLGVKPAEDDNEKGWRNVTKLNEMVFGQEEATKKVADKIIGSYVGFKAEKEPIATFLLTGPTGVGKTETAKAVADLCCDGNLFTVDMTTFKHEADISRLLGASPGYVGYGEKNSFCSFLLEHPDGVLLFDEIEKAAKGCLDLLMRILDEGEFIDAKGNIISLNRAVVFCTTNLTEYLNDDEKNTPKSVEEKMTSEDGLRKEIVGRFHEVIEYKRLSYESCKNIVDKFINSKIEGFYKKNEELNLQLSYTDNLIDQIIREANTDLLGARDLKKTIQKLFISPVSYYVIKNEPTNVNLVVDTTGITEEKLKENTHNNGLNI